MIILLCHINSQVFLLILLQVSEVCDIMHSKGHRMNRLCLDSMFISQLDYDYAATPGSTNMKVKFNDFGLWSIKVKEHHIRNIKILY